MIQRVLDWLNARTGYRRARTVLLDEPLPPGTGWLFTLGSVLLALLTIQVVTGALLTLYYAPTPDHAYDSVLFINATTAGRLVRGLHHYAASFIVVAAALHLLRVVSFGSFKAPRELTWLSGVVLLLLILAFALTGYLLPWDQRAYWATVVTINIARLAPVAGDAVASVLQGGSTIGALTLTRWYAAHVIFLPALLVILVVAHVALMRRHGISGPVRAKTGRAVPFYPYHAARDVAVVLVVVGTATALAWNGMPPLEGRADPTATGYVPRPEWYFLGLFELLKYFPGRWELVGAIVIPTVAITLLALLPWIDRSRAREPHRRPVVMGVFAFGTLAIIVLTALGWSDRPAAVAAGGGWSLHETAGHVLANDARCTTCHIEGGVGDPLGSAPVSRSLEWISGHLLDPEMIAPGLREPPRPFSEREMAAIMAYVRRLGRAADLGVPAETNRTAALVFARACTNCHVIDGEGGSRGPDLSRIGETHDLDTLRRLIANPKSVNPEATMPSFGRRLTPAELDAIATYLARRQGS